MLDVIPPVAGAAAGAAPADGAAAEDAKTISDATVITAPRSTKRVFITFLLPTSGEVVVGRPKALSYPGHMASNASNPD
ncbi:MAG: hypothetical protein ACJ743_00525 [Gaiellaceae bacterium]